MSTCSNGLDNGRSSGFLSQFSFFEKSVITFGDEENRSAASTSCGNDVLTKYIFFNNENSGSLDATNKLTKVQKY